MRKSAFLLLFAFLFLMVKQEESVADKGIKIFLNGVDVTGLTDQSFKGCTVTFDSQGNIYINAPGYRVKRIETDEQTKVSSSVTTSVTSMNKPSKKYFLVTEHNNGSKVWDDYTVLINGNIVKKFNSKDGLILEDITKYVTKGKNQIVITATKSPGYPGGSPSYWYRIIIGEGHEQGKKIIIDKSLIRFTRKASDTEPGGKTFTINIK